MMPWLIFLLIQKHYKQKNKEKKRQGRGTHIKAIKVGLE